MQIIDKTEILNENIFNEYIEMIGKDKYQNIIQMFIDDINTRTKNIIASHETNDKETLTREIHTLKSVSYTIGGSKLGHISKLLEEESISRKLTKSELEEYYNIINELLDAISSKIN